MRLNEPRGVVLPERASALRIIEKLRQGTDCLEGVNTFSAGRALLLAAATEHLEELEVSGGASVRWVRGRIGQGKTHFFARLIETAHARNWVTSYVQISERGGGVELHRFQQVYAAIVRNCLCRDLVALESGQIEPGRISGWGWILNQWWQAVRRQVTGGKSGDVPTLRLQEALDQTITALRRRWSIHTGFAEALRQFALAEMDGDAPWSETLLQWFQGEDVHGQGSARRPRLRSVGITESLKPSNAREMLRSLSAFLRYRGFGGVLILVDELENVLPQPPASRRTAWTILRELIDNIDARHGMTHTAFYVAATPDVFDSEKGMTEYEALAERVLLPGTNWGANPMGSVIDLAAWPLQREDFVHIGGSITALHSVARNWHPGPEARDELAELLIAELQRDRDLTARSWVKAAVNRLDGLRERRVP